MFGSRDGLVFLKNDRAQTLYRPQYPALKRIVGITQTGSGETWLSSSSNIFSVPTANLMRAFADPKAPLHLRTLDATDGLPAGALADLPRAAVKGGDGRLWFATRAGTVWVNPLRLIQNKVIPTVAIRSLTANGIKSLDPKMIKLPAGTNRIEISFAALSFSVPERVRVRYKLEGEDATWVEPGMRRQAYYTNLSPGHYAFRVVAANEDGVWNSQGARVEFDIPPTFTQSVAFKIICLLAVALVLWGAYLARIKHVTNQMRSRLEERLAERERIARDLHDTLLQGFQGLIMRFQSVANEIPRDERVRSLIEQTLDTADDVLQTGRDSVRQLRAGDELDLCDTLAATAEQLRQDYPVGFEMVIEGTPRALHPVVRDEVSRIGNEALINAFRHAKASVIELVVSFKESSLAVGVRDDGVGIDPGIVEQGGRQGHFGLVGMRERALEIEGELSVLSREGGGTEVHVSVPGRTAYNQEIAGNWWNRLFQRKGE